MYIDLTCPAEVFRTVLPTEEIPAAALTLFNLSDRVITSAEVMLRLLDKRGMETEKLSYRGRALNGRPHSTFMMTVPCAAAGVCAAEVSIEKVWFQDKDVWRRNPANAIEYTPNALPVSRALTNLQYVAGDTAVGFPAIQDGVWICVCGRPNPEEETTTRPFWSITQTSMMSFCWKFSMYSRAPVSNLSDVPPMY